MKVTCKQCKRRIRLKKSRNIVCKCGFVFRYTKYFGNEKIYLVDANIIIYSLSKDGEHSKVCKRVLMREDLAITDRVLDEVHKDIPYNFKRYKVDYSLKLPAP